MNIMWFSLATVLYGISFYTYGINKISANIDHFINLHNPVNDNIILILYK
jgi:hypothetical protein